MSILSVLSAVLVDPFLDFTFMRRALVACLCLAIGGGPVGTFLILRRMSLMGDAMSHAVLPGAAIGYLIAGLSLGPMSIGGVVAGLLVALLSGVVTRLTPLREDANFAAFYLISLAAGVLIVSAHGSNVDLLHVLFGTILGVDDAALFLMAGVATLTCFTLAIIYRALVIECFDPGFLRAVDGRGGLVHGLFLTLVVVNLVAGFQALGTLMAVGLMMLPAAAARFWVQGVWRLSLVAAAIALASGYVGLLLSYHFDLASGPAIVLVAGAAYVGSLIVGRRSGLLGRLFVPSHLEA